MNTTRRDFVVAAVTAAGATATPDLAHGDTHDHQAVPSDAALRVKSLESLLVEKKIVDRATLDALIDTFEHKVGPRNGARVVARAWVGPAYKPRLLASATAEERYMVLPERPAGTEHLSEDALAALVTRDAMIGVAKVKLTQTGGRG